MWSFWLPSALITLMVVTVIALGFLRGARLRAEAQAQGTQDAGGSTGRRELRIYADQLREIESDLKRGLVTEEEVERLRTEISRRLLEADRAKRRDVAKASPGMRLVGLALLPVTVVFAVLLYATAGAPHLPDRPLAQRHAEAAQLRAERPRQDELEAAWAANPNRPEPPAAEPEMMALIEQLRTAMATRPLDLQGHQLLARNEAGIGNHAGAAAAQARVIELKGDQATTADHVLLAEAMIFAAGGLVSPEAERVLETILRRDPDNQPARYYTGLMFAQTERPDLTFQIWRQLLIDSHPQAPWVPHLRETLEELAEIAGVTRYTLPPIEAQGARGPSAADMAAAMELDEDARAEMIGGMVEGLSARLATQGGTADEWARLIVALGVLGQTDRARAIWSEARTVFADRAEEMALIDQAARGVGFLE
ncbi:MAG: c-type cytochrome biogenesis protein CcmI [Pararhodobacter sp.]|nr:c-type cytochrome biogenesis protein CcmI [Pararhodobacter sp.]